MGRLIDMARPSPTRVFHFTRVEHLANVARSGLLCDRLAQATGALEIEVGDRAIKSRRESRPVPVAPGGMVADYVPFYFAPRSPMMYSIYCGNVPGYNEGTNRLVYLVTSLERLADIGLEVVLSDRNAVLGYTDFVRFGDGEPDDDFIDWPLMRQTMWNNSDEHPDRRERRMAECLVHERVPWDAFRQVVVRSASVADEVRQLFGEAHEPSVAVRPQWYF